jgi:hypothetical protein
MVTTSTLQGIPMADVKLVKKFPAFVESENILPLREESVVVPYF